MLRNSFVLLKGIGPGTERRLWENGLHNWDDFLGATEIGGIGEKRKSALDAHIRALEKCLERSDASVIASALPRNQLWRMYPNFAADAAFLDIETTGLDLPAEITLVGILFRGVYTPLVRGISLSETAIKRALSGAKLLVTFNGGSFDLPAIRMSYPGALEDIPHLDLRHLAPRAGVHGGLKKVEWLLGIRREREIRMLVSHDAVYLWRIWVRKRSANALRLLIDYNRADTENLRTVADEIVRRMAKKTLIPI